MKLKPMKLKPTKACSILLGNLIKNNPCGRRVPYLFNNRMHKGRSLQSKVTQEGG